MAATSVPYNVRTVTVGVELAAGDHGGWVAAMRHAVTVLDEAARRAAVLGPAPQTLRVATNGFDKYMDVSSLGTILADVKVLADATPSHVLLCIGRVESARVADLIPGVVSAFPTVTCSYAVGTVPAGAAVVVPDMAAARRAAGIMKAIARETPRGEGNFFFAATSNCLPNTPFFPAAYHEGRRSVALGFENPGLVHEALTGAGGDLATASTRLADALTTLYKPYEAMAEALCAEFDYAYTGIDASVAPSPTAPSLVEGFEALSGGRFGSSGCVAVASMITQTLKSLPLKLSGYTGLMLPPLEDTGLAARAAEGSYDIRNLLEYSSVCGLGLDTVPIPGDTPTGRIAALIGDVCALAYRLKKPLSVRLFVTVGKAAGEMTEFENPHMCNGPVFTLK